MKIKKEIFKIQKPIYTSEKENYNKVYVYNKKRTVEFQLDGTKEINQLFKLSNEKFKIYVKGYIREGLLQIEGVVGDSNFNW